MKRPNTCVHFCGIQNVCKAGIDPVTVRDSSHAGPYRWPCLTLDNRPASTSCAKYQEPTDAEIKADADEFAAALEAMRERQSRGECSECGTKVSAVRQGGRCVYASPCGHRLGQGNAERVAESMGLR